MSGEAEVVGREGRRGIVRIPRSAFGDTDIPTHRAVVAGRLGDAVDLYVSPALRRLIEEPAAPFVDARNLAAASLLAASRGQYLWDVDVAIALGADPNPDGVQRWRSANGVPRPPAGWPASWSPDPAAVVRAQSLAAGDTADEPAPAPSDDLAQDIERPRVDPGRLPVSVGDEFDGYRIERELGRGGMGVVFLASDVVLNSPVALKIIAPHLTDSEVVRQRFLREARIAASLRHPSTVQVYKAGEARGTLYVCMRYIDGPALHEVIRRDVFLDPLRAVAIISQVAGALDEAHEQGLVHRDVKPQNILLTKIGAQEFAYLSDFGLARAIEDTGLTRTGVALGTPSYMSPELITGGAIGPASDVYALGCVLFESITGAKPFERESSQAVLFAHAHEPPPRATEANNGLPLAFDHVIERAMAKNPADRHKSAGALASDAAAALGEG